MVGEALNREEAIAQTQALPSDVILIAISLMKGMTAMGTSSKNRSAKTRSA
ncbi:MAG: hypothetical protein AAGE59_24510 [Cyanobacteria bacterium P01_F01_bin.86]